MGMASTACSTTGADKRLSASVVDKDTVILAVDTVDRQAPPRKKAASHDTLTLAFTGDIMMGTTYPEPVLPANDGKSLFKDVREILSNADIAAGNLEGTLCDSAQTTKKDGKYSYAFRTPVSFAPRLKEAGYDFLSMANNHSFDFGLTGIRSTESALDGLGIKYAGIRGRIEATVTERDGVRYGFCAFGHNSYTVRHQDMKMVKEIIDTLRSMADIVVVSFHGGAEGKDMSHLPYGKETFLGEDRGSLRDFAHFCIDNGADIVYGHGPHVVRCIEVYRDRLIAYSLGNFCTPYGINTTGISGYAPVLEVMTDRKGVFLKGRIHSFKQKRGIGPRLDTTNAAARQMRSLTLTDIKNPAFTISSDGTITPKGR